MLTMDDKTDIPTDISNGGFDLQRSSTRTE